MEWFIAILAVVVIGFAAVAAAGGLGQLGPVTTDRPPLKLPDGDLTAADVADTRFSVVPRGYAMAEVDELLERLAAQLGQGYCPDEPESGIIDPNRNSDVKDS